MATIPSQGTRVSRRFPAWSGEHTHEPGWLPIAPLGTKGCECLSTVAVTRGDDQVPPTGTRGGHKWTPKGIRLT